MDPRDKMGWNINRTWDSIDWPLPVTAVPVSILGVPPILFPFQNLRNYWTRLPLEIRTRRILFCRSFFPFSVLLCFCLPFLGFSCLPPFLFEAMSNSKAQRWARTHDNRKADATAKRPTPESPKTIKSKWALRLFPNIITIQTASVSRHSSNTTVLFTRRDLCATKITVQYPMNNEWER